MRSHSEEGGRRRPRALFTALHGQACAGVVLRSATSASWCELPRRVTTMSEGPPTAADAQIPRRARERSALLPCHVLLTQRVQEIGDRLAGTRARAEFAAAS